MPCIKWSLITLASVYSTIGLMLMLFSVFYYLPRIRDAQHTQGLLMDKMSADIGKTAKSAGDVASDSLDTNLLVNIMAATQNQHVVPLLEGLLNLNQRELNATLLLLQVLGGG